MVPVSMNASSSAQLIRPWLAEFRDPARERAFRVQETRGAARGLYLGLLVVVLADIASAWVEWELFSTQAREHLWHVMAARASVLAAAAVFAAVIRWRPLPEVLDWSLLGSCIVVGIMQGVVSNEYVTWLRHDDSPFWFALFAFLVLAVFPTQLRIGWSCCASLFAPALLLHILVLGSSRHVVTDFVVVFLLVCGMGTALANRLNRSRRHEFALLASQRQVNVLLQSEVEQRTQATARLLEDKSELEARLQQAQRIQALGRLAGGVAHDLNNLLTPILGYAEIARAEVTGRDEQLAVMMDEITHSALRARDLVQQLLAFSRKQVLETKLLDLNRLVREHVTTLHQLTGTSVALRIQTAEVPAIIQADATQLGQVLMNLSVNAADAMPDGGTLTISVRQEDVTTTDTGIAPGSYAVLTIDDTGVGMDEATREHIFEPFFTTKRERHSGLGLATVYGIVQQHGGTIRLRSAPGKGTSFMVYMPRSTNMALPAGTADTSVRRGLEGRSETILLVDDEDEVRRLIEVLLRRAGFHVLSARSAEEALILARRHQGPIQVLLTDVSMPGMSGPELWSLIRDERQETRALFVSGYTDEVLGRDSQPAGRVAFLQKPFTRHDLDRMLRRLLGDAVATSPAAGATSG